MKYVIDSRVRCALQTGSEVNQRTLEDEGLVRPCEEEEGLI